MPGWRAGAASPPAGRSVSRAADGRPHRRSVGASARQSRLCAGDDAKWAGSGWGIWLVCGVYLLRRRKEQRARRLPVPQTASRIADETTGSDGRSSDASDQVAAGCDDARAQSDQACRRACHQRFPAPATKGVAHAVIGVCRAPQPSRARCGCGLLILAPHAPLLADPVAVGDGANRCRRQSHRRGKALPASARPPAPMPATPAAVSSTPCCVWPWRSSLMPSYSSMLPPTIFQPAHHAAKGRAPPAAPAYDWRPRLGRCGLGGASRGRGSR